LREDFEALSEPEGVVPLIICPVDIFRCEPACSAATPILD